MGLRLAIQAKWVLVVVDVRFFDGFVFVPETESAGNPESQNHADQQENRDRNDPKCELVGNHGETLYLF